MIKMFENIFSTMTGLTTGEDILVGGTIFLLVLVIGLIILGIYIYQAIAWMTVAGKLKYKRKWFAWVPFFATAMRLQLAGFHWAWTFLWLVPILGWIAIYVMMFFVKWNIYEQRKYPGWLALFGLVDWVLSGVGSIAELVILGFVAWGDGWNPMVKTKPLTSKNILIKKKRKLPKKK